MCTSAPGHRAGDEACARLPLGGIFVIKVEPFAKSEASTWSRDTCRPNGESTALGNRKSEARVGWHASRDELQDDPLRPWDRRIATAALVTDSHFAQLPRREKEDTKTRATAHALATVTHSVVSPTHSLTHESAPSTVHSTRVRDTRHISEGAQQRSHCVLGCSRVSQLLPLPSSSPAPLRRGRESKGCGLPALPQDSLRLRCRALLPLRLLCLRHNTRLLLRVSLCVSLCDLFLRVFPLRRVRGYMSARSGPRVLRDVPGRALDAESTHEEVQLVTGKLGNWAGGFGIKPKMITGAHVSITKDKIALNTLTE